jgi:hypothetical protein
VASRFDPETGAPSAEGLATDQHPASIGKTIGAALGIERQTLDEDIKTGVPLAACLKA